VGIVKKEIGCWRCEWCGHEWFSVADPYRRDPPRKCQRCNRLHWFTGIPGKRGRKNTKAKKAKTFKTPIVAAQPKRPPSGKQVVTMLKRMA
jgi:hypothetical protein